MLFKWLHSLHNQLMARVERWFRAREVIKTLKVAHAVELSETPGEWWGIVRTKQAEQIAAVRAGQFDIVDRRSWAFPYLPESLHRLNQPILKNCFSADTEILTTRGWLPIPSLVKGDKVISRMEDGTAKWVPVRELKKFKYAGKMFHFTGKFVDLLVSPDHRMYGRFRAPRLGYWGDQKTCTVCNKEFTRAQALGSHRKKIHGIEAASGYNDTSKKPRHYFYEYGPIGFSFAKDVVKWLREHGPSIHSFEIPVATEWVGKFPKGYDFKTDTVSVDRYTKKGRGNHWKSETRQVLLKDLVAFLGIYVAEGASSGSFHGIDSSADSALPHHIQAVKAVLKAKPSGNGFGVGVSQTRKSPHFREIQRLMLRLPWKLEYKDHSQAFCVGDKNLWDLVSPLGNSYTKYIPRWVKELPAEYIRIFIEWACKGDGLCTDEGGLTYYTVSKRLADDMQELFLKAGWEGNLRTIKQGGSKAFGLKASRQAPLYAISRHRFAFKGVSCRNIEEVPYSGYIYCPAIPPHETVYVRRNGKASWCGRTPYNLRRFSETPIPRRAINLIKNSVNALRWEIRTVPDVENNPDRQLRIRIATECFRRPNNADSFRSFSEAVLEDLIIGGYGCIEPQMTPYYKRPIKMWPVDGSTIRIFPDWSEGQPDKTKYAQMTGLKGERGVVVFLADELSYIRANVRSSTPFGLGMLEVAFNSVNAFLGIQDMSARAGADQIHKTWLWWEATQNPSHIQIVRRHVQNEIEGQAKLSLIAGLKKPEVIEVTPVKPEDLLLEWQEFLIRIIANAFNMSPLSLGLERDVNRNTGQIMQDADFRSAVVPTARSYEEALTRDILHTQLGWRDLEFAFLNLDDLDILTNTIIQQRQYMMDAITPDEARRSAGRPPLPGGWGRLTLGMKQLWMLYAAAKMGVKGGASPGGGGASGGATGGGGASGSLGTTGMLGSGFEPDDIKDMSPEEIQEYQQMGMLPQGAELPTQMDVLHPGIMEELSDELQEFFETVDKESKKGQIKPAKITPGDEKEQAREFVRKQHQPTVIEQRMGDRGMVRVPAPGYMKNKKYQPWARGKYPRSGGDTGNYR